MARGIPPGVHVHAPVELGSGGSRRARILGDDARGYLLAGVASLVELHGEEFWFATFDEALACGERLGIPRDAWTEIVDVSEVPSR